MRKKSNVTSEKSQEEKMIEREERLEENLEEKRELKEKHEIAGPYSRRCCCLLFRLCVQEYCSSCSMPQT